MYQYINMKRLLFLLLLIPVLSFGQQVLTYGGKVLTDGTNVLTYTASYLTILEDGNTVAWYIADDLTTITKDGANLVSRWNDYLGSGHDLLQAGADNLKPLWSATGIYFTSAAFTQFMKTAPFTLNQPTIVYIVFKQIDWTDNYYIFDGNATRSMSLRQDIATPDWRISAGVSGFETGIPLNTFRVVRILYNGAASGYSIDESALTVKDYGNVNAGGFELGSRGGGTQVGANIEIKEIILRKIADPAADQLIIYDYLKDKYGL